MQAYVLKMEKGRKLIRIQIPPELLKRFSATANLGFEPAYLTVSVTNMSHF
jgi:hypothetical protein